MIVVDDIMFSTINISVIMAKTSDDKRASIPMLPGFQRSLRKV